MKGYLVLETGDVFAGTRFGAPGDVIAELVFTTGMVGYLETLTDKGYAGQIVVQTFPLIGNYGVIPPDFEGNEIGPCGYIVKEWCQFPSNFRSEENLDTFFVSKNTVALSGIDTRALTKRIRAAGGALNGCITSDPASVNLADLKAYKVQNQVAPLSTKETYTVTAENETHNVALLDCGTRNSAVREFVKRGCTVTVFPHNTSAETILATKPNGIIVSGGPGNPAENTEVIETLKSLASSSVPMFGIDLGHQLIALAHGFCTEKLPYGHRGSNQPVRHVPTGKVYITNQNHQYAVSPSSVDSQAALLFEHVNDNSVEGLIYHNAPIFSVQFRPGAIGGPLDTNFLLDTFVEMMGGNA